MYVEYFLLSSRVNPTKVSFLIIPSRQGPASFSFVSNIYIWQLLDMPDIFSKQYRKMVYSEFLLALCRFSSLIFWSELFYLPLCLLSRTVKDMKFSQLHPKKLDYSLGKVVQFITNTMTVARA